MYVSCCCWVVDMIKTSYNSFCQPTHQTWIPLQLVLLNSLQSPDGTYFENPRHHHHHHKNKTKQNKTRALSSSDTHITISRNNLWAMFCNCVSSCTRQIHVLLFYTAKSTTTSPSPLQHYSKLAFQWGAESGRKISICGLTYNLFNMY